MESKVLITPKFVISVIIFFMVCLIGSVSEAGSEILTHAVPATKDLIQVVAFENDTDLCEFQVFYGSQSASAFIFPQSIFHFGSDKGLFLSTKEIMSIKCCKGSFLPVFVQHGGVASGEAQEGFEGPFYLSMWLQYPQVPEHSKINIRYVVKSGTVGTVGIKVGKKGDYRFVSYDNVKFVL